MKITTKPSNKPRVNASGGGGGSRTIDSSDWGINLIELDNGDELVEPLAIAPYGPAGSGKTRFAMTAPGPIGLVALDRKTRGTALKIARELEKKVIVPDEDFIRGANPLRLAILPPDCGQRVEIPLGQRESPMCCAIHYYRWHVNRVKAAAFRMAEMEEVKTIVIDSATQLWEDILFANFGRSMRIMPRDRGTPNQEMIDFINAISHKHLILTHEGKDMWAGEGLSAKPVPGQFKLSGFPGIDYKVNVIVQLTRNEKNGLFKSEIKMCQANQSLHGDKGKSKETGMEGEMINFQMLASLIYPNVDAERWE